MLKKRKCKMNMGKRIGSLALALSLMLTLVSVNAVDAEAAVTLSGSQVASYCNGKVGTTYPAGYCLAWVASIFRELGAGSSSACCAYNYGSSHIVSTSSDNIPVGADVFFSGSTYTCSNCGNKCGHVAIYVGDGYIVHSYSGKVHKDKLTTVMGWSNTQYRGWGYHGNVALSNSSPVVKGEQTISNGRYHIVSNLNENMGLDVAGASKANGANINLYSNTTDNTQTFDITYLGDGYYKIINSYSGKAVDVNAASSASGTNVHSYEQNGSNAQKWIIKETGDRYTYNIISACGYKYLDVAGASTQNGTNVQIYDGNGTNAQKWKFIAVGNNTGKTIENGEYHIVSALDNNKGVDVTGASKANFTNIQLYSNVTDKTQTFDVTYLGDGYYKIIGRFSGKALDVNGCQTYKYSNVQLCEWNNSNAQKWIIKKNGSYYNIIAKASGMYLDVNAANSANGTNIQIYTGNNTKAQMWRFVPVVKEQPVTEETKVTETKQEDNKAEDEVTPEQKDTKAEDVVIPKQEDNKVEDEIIPEQKDDKVEDEIIPEQKDDKVEDEILPEQKDDKVEDEIIPEQKDTKAEDVVIPKQENSKTEDEVTPEQEHNQPIISDYVAEKNEPSANDYVWEDAGEDDDWEVEVPIFKSVKNVKKCTMKIRISSVMDVDGYEYTVAKVNNSTLKKFKKQVRNADDEKISFKGAKTYLSKSTTVKLSGLKKNKKYAVAVRAYRVIEGEKYYSDYSAVKCIKIKK